MYLPKTQEDRESEIALQSLSQKVSMEQTTTILESILIWVILSYLDDDSFRLPYLGDVKVHHDGDIIIGGEKEAQLTVTINPTDLLKRIIGQIEDNKQTDVDIAFIEKIIHEIELKLEE